MLSNKHARDYWMVTPESKTAAVGRRLCFVVIKDWYIANVSFESDTKLLKSGLAKCYATCLRMRNLSVSPENLLTISLIISRRKTATSPR